MDHRPGQIIFIHGPSSAGKSTLARALQAEIDVPFWHISIDHLRDSGVLPLDRVRAGDFDWKAMRAPFFDGFHASLSSYARAGNNLILEHILDTEGWDSDLRKLFDGLDVFFVGLHCALETLNAREAVRGDRPAGSAAADFHRVHLGRRYDLEVQSEDGVEANVARILTGWRSGRRRSEFAPSAD